MTRRARRLIQVGAGATLGLVVAGLVALPQSRAAVPPTLGADVPLVDDRGAARTLADFQGSWTLLFFGFTHCPDICPVSLTRIAAGLDELRSRGTPMDLDVLLVTVDPERDTPDVLADYLSPFGEQFVGLTGTGEDLDALYSAYDVTVQGPAAAAASGGEGHAHSVADIAHTARIHVLDPEGRRIGEIPPWPGASDMADALASILSSPS